MDVEVLVPTVDRPGALAVTLAGLAAQDVRGGTRIVIGDQSARPVADDPLVQAMVRIVEQHGGRVRLLHNLPRRGIAENRAFVLSQSEARYVLFLDDDVWLEPWAISRLGSAIAALACGFVGYPLVGLSYRDDHRPAQLVTYQEFAGSVDPERVRRGTPAWLRHQLHNAANPLHLARRLDLLDQHGVPTGPWRAYKVAWIGGCVLYDRAALVEAGGFDFWTGLPPEHAGEDVVAQLRVMQRRGGAGILPSAAVHLELPTTLPNREHNCYDLVDLDQPADGSASGRGCDQVRTDATVRAGARPSG